MRIKRSAGGAHPDLATHDALGLSTDAELTTHAAVSAASTHGNLGHANTNDPSAGEKAALAGTAGTPSGTNKYVTNDDTRNTDARTPTAHTMASHSDDGALATKSTVATADIDDNAVTLAKLLDIATASFLGRTTAATGDPEVLTATQATALLNVFTSALKGLVPASGGGTTTFLRADGAFAAPTAAAADPSYSPGSFTVATETGRYIPNHLKLAGAQRATVAGTARLVIC